MQKTKDWVTGI